MPRTVGCTRRRSLYVALTGDALDRSIRLEMRHRLALCSGRMHPLLASLAPLVSKPSTTADDRAALVFDWEAVSTPKRSAFLDDIFDGVEPDSVYASLVSAGRSGKLAWVSERLVPFALLDVDASTTKWVFSGGTRYPQFGALLLADLEARSTPVFAVEVDGTAVEAEKLKKVATSLAKLGLRGEEPAPTEKGTKKARSKKAVPAGAASAKAAPAPAAPLKDSKAAMTRDSEAAAAVEKALSPFLTHLTAYRYGLHGIQYAQPGFKDVQPNPAGAKAARPKCEAALKKLETLLGATPRFASLEASGVVADYRGLLETIAKGPPKDAWWKRAVIARLQHDTQYFRSLSADLHHKAAGTSWWPARDLASYAPPKTKA